MAQKRRTKIGKVSVFLGKRPSYVQEKPGRIRDSRTGRFISWKNARRRKKEVSGGTAKAEVTRSIRTLKPFDPTIRGAKGMTEVTYCIAIPIEVRRAHSTEFIDALAAGMRRDGHDTRPGKIGKLERVKFFAYWEGRGASISTGRTITGHSRIPGEADLDVLVRQAKSKTRAIYEGRSLANDPFKTIDSGDWILPSGPRLFCITAVYHPKERVP